jgi:hypothetical protein
MVSIGKKRECGDCTMCCEGHLSGDVYGKKFWKGLPCHFVTKNKGCNIYKDRPHHPCKSYKCAWISSDELPYWMKPNQIDAIIDWRVSDLKEKYLNVIEGNEDLKVEVLNWVLHYCFNNNYNLVYNIKGNSYYFGNDNFLKEVKNWNK